LVRDTDLEPLAIEIQYCRRRSQCRACAHSYVTAGENFVCPACGMTDPEFTGGDELELAYLEVENGACAAGTQGAQ
jgi:Zn finger protein HypA/HybF involved in hydrogenase expression